MDTRTWDLNKVPRVDPFSSPDRLANTTSNLLAVQIIALKAIIVAFARFTLPASSFNGLS